MELFAGIMIPFAGTALGAACVFFLKHEMKPLVQRSLLGFASGVMVAAAVWSLLIPAMDMSEAMGKFAFIPGAVGFLLGILFLLGMDKLIPHLHIGASQPEGKKSSLKKTTMLVLAVTLHNICRCGFCRYAGRKYRNYPGGSHGSVRGNRYPKLSGGGHYILAASE